mmetsp:Transcript_13597/g.29438  ORF Transcript_13597/g.29438 Transcript_13597/m.29438 type:complete len:882 (+) Transcript_13597:168-2813(+)|eukprot:CAMPEP_0172551512 /NCGR_PEP_ID=MMETSP1067-20121228/40045_1 /TAXON_ID=265564 ORGANISM="Thalassiosira punctigera, Strain Tpunct2005C2" /NCGR_SAMPLE_ID=MMETSP1067 /ASSEMBLY_ACC=CAM_ASM_000444 /LENGTH=881 /DNA_ID=CAMNT_0013339313 /DNA_START=168 /DNA_END=2813 /DNA_ORIENTATION=-
MANNPPAARPLQNGGGPQGDIPAIDATPKGYTIDVRVFLAIITTAMALAFTAGVMIGPTNPALVDPILSLLGVPPSAYDAPNPSTEKAIGGGSRKIDPASNINAPARKRAEGAAASISVADPRTSKKAKEVLVTADGQVISENDDVVIKQPKRTPTDHVATLGYKIKETHVNIDTPVLEGTGEKVPFDRDITYDNATREDVKGDGEPLLRDQSNPSGQHLLVDIKNLEAAFLNSESRLADAMQASVKAGGLTMLSYHCHSLHPAGVSCVGVLLESHISFHTWPDEGVITLDLFTTSEKPLLPVLPKIEELFGVPRINEETGEKEKIVTLWSHELRGFRTEDARKAHYLDGESDLANWVTSPLEVVYKKQIVTMQTEHQRIDIWDTLERDDTPSYEDGLRLGLKAGDPRWLSNEHATPSRMLFLDGALQTIHDAEKEYHESLVQPAMFAHAYPKTVAIIGGGEGSTLREVLKHKSVEKVTMIEIDERVVQVCREHMPSMSNCSEIVGSTPSCFDDPRTELIIADAFKYFVDKQIKDQFDVLIVDAKDPEEHDEYTDPMVINALIDSLTSEGVVAFNVGMAPSILDPRADKGVNPKRELLINNLERGPGVASIHVYEESHCGFWEPRSFLVACRDVGCRKRWYAETDEVDYQVYERIGGTESGENPSLVHFDGATQRSFWAPPRAWETIYCHREPTPFECEYRGLDLEKELFEYFPDDEEGSAFEIRPTIEEDGEDGAAVYAKVDVPEGSYVMPTHLAASFEVSDDSMENIRGDPVKELDGVGRATVIEDFIEFIDEYGHASLQAGSGKNFVEIGGSFLIRVAEEDASEANVRRWIPRHPKGGRPKYSPVYDRHRHSFDVFLVASRDIKAGEEIVKPPALWED